MPTTVNLRKLLHRKSPEYCNPIVSTLTTAGGFVVSDKNDIVPGHDSTYYVAGVSSIWNYNSNEDSWMQIPNSGLPGTFNPGSCGEFLAVSAPGGNITHTAFDGSSDIIYTTLNLARNLAGCTVMVVAGAGAGYVGKIRRNTIGPDSSIWLEEPLEWTMEAPAFNNTTQFRIFGGSLWFFNAGAGAVGFGVYDRATNTWTSRSVAGLPATWGRDAQLVSTPGFASNGGAGFDAANVVSATGTTLVAEWTQTAAEWRDNAWTNSQVRITDGTGKGQIRTIASNTDRTLTVSTPWTVNPNSTSKFRIEGNDNFLYLFGNSVVTAYRFSISTNTWSTLSPVAARAGAPMDGATADWVDDQAPDSFGDISFFNYDWLTPNGTIIHQNGRYIYSFRGGGSNILDVYDIAANTWISALRYGNQQETFGLGSNSWEMDGFIYIQKDGTGRILRFNVARNTLEPFTINPIPQGTAVIGDKMFGATYKDGATKIRWLYTMGNTRNDLIRWLIV